MKTFIGFIRCIYRNFSKMFYWCGIYLFNSNKYEYGGFNHLLAGKIFRWKYSYIDISITRKIKFKHIRNSYDYYYDGYHNCLWIGCVRINYAHNVPSIAEGGN